MGANIVAMKKYIFLTSSLYNARNILQIINTDHELSKLQHEIVVEFFNVPLEECEFDYCLSNLYSPSEIDALLSALRDCEIVPIEFIHTDEYSVLAASELNRKFGLNGIKYEIANLFRNKKLMYQRVSKAELALPVRWENLDDANIPFVIKPISEAASIGVKVISDDSQLEECTWGKENVIFEEYIDSGMYHIDGAIQSNSLIFSAVSKYLGTCFDFFAGEPIGTIYWDRDKNQWSDYLSQILKVFPFPDGVFHIEVFQRSNGEIVFLELACRPAGAPLDIQIKHAHNVDINTLHLRLRTGLPVKDLLAQRTKPQKYLVAYYPKKAVISSNISLDDFHFNAERLNSSLIDSSIPLDIGNYIGAISNRDPAVQFTLLSSTYCTLKNDLERISDLFSDIYSLRLSDYL